MAKTIAVVGNIVIDEVDGVYYARQLEQHYENLLIEQVLPAIKKCKLPSRGWVKSAFSQTFILKSLQAI